MATENSPLLPTTAPKPPRNVTFHPQQTVVSPGGTTSTSLGVTGLPTHHTSSTSPSSQLSASGLAALNSKLRRRNSSGAPAIPNTPLPRIGPQRTTKNAEKLQFLPNVEHVDGDEESGRDVYSQFTKIKDPTARRDAARLGKADRDRLPRVTAYCMAKKYQLTKLTHFLQSRSAKQKGANPKIFDQVIYSPYQYARRRSPVRKTSEVQSLPVTAHDRRHSDGSIEVHGNGNGVKQDDLIDLHTTGGDISVSNGGVDTDSSNHHDLVESMRDTNITSESNLEFDTHIHTAEVFIFDYGVVVIWGMSLVQEQRFLKEISEFAVDPLPAKLTEIEDLNFYYTQEYQARIYNDFITLRDKKDYMGKLAMSHALAQSVKTNYFEDFVDRKMSVVEEIPSQMAEDGKITLSKKEINMLIGSIFGIRMDLHLNSNGSILDEPDLFWSEPKLLPVYQAVRGYLEIDQRAEVLQTKLGVIKDMLDMLKEQLNNGHSEYLEWIVIVLIAAEIIVATINIVIDIWAGSE